MGVIDPHAMFRAGYASRAKARSGQAELADTIDKILGFVGTIAMKRFDAGLNELTDLRKKSRSTKADINTLVHDVGAELNPVFKTALKDWTKEYDKGSKMATMGLTSKRKEKGQSMMDFAYSKMQNMHMKFQDLSAKHALYEKQGLLELNEDVPGFTGKKWNSGTTSDQRLNAAQLANGTLFKNMSIDPNSGEIVLLKEIEDPNNPGNMIVDTIPYDQIDWPDNEDDSLQGIQKGYIDNSIGRGEKGKVWDEMHGKYTYDEITGSVNGSSNAAKRSYFFGGTANDFSSGKMESSSPAYMMLTEQGFTPGTPQWKGQLELMKSNLDFNEGSAASQRIIDLMYGASQRYHNNSYGNWEAKQAKSIKSRRRSVSRPDKTKTFKGANLSFGYKTKIQMDGQVKKIEAEQPQMKSLDGITWKWNPENEKYETETADGTISYSKKQMLEHNELTEYYPDKFSANKIDKLKVASETSMIDDMPAMEWLEQYSESLSNVER